MSLYINGGFLGHTQRLTEPIAFVGGITYAGGSTASITGINLSGLVGGLNSTPQKDDLVVVTLASASTANRTLTCSGNVTGTYNGAYTELYIASATTYDTNLETFYQFMGDTPDTSLTLTSTTASTSDAWAVVIQVWRFVDRVTPLDVSSTTATASSSGLADPPAITPVTQGTVILVVGAAAHALGATAFFASPEDAQLTFFTTAGNSTNDITVGMGSYREWTSGAYNPTAFRLTATNPTNGSWAAATIALRPEHPVTGASGVWNVRAKYQDSMRYG